MQETKEHKKGEEEEEEEEAVQFAVAIINKSVIKINVLLFTNDESASYIRPYMKERTYIESFFFAGD